MMSVCLLYLVAGPVAMMWFLSVRYACINWGVWTTLLLYLIFAVSGEKRNWGDVFQVGRGRLSLCGRPID
jgi:hypothetical protein